MTAAVATPSLIGVIASLALFKVVGAASIVLALVLGIGAGAAAFRALVARTIRELRPGLSVMVGELPSPPLDAPLKEEPAETRWHLPPHM